MPVYSGVITEIGSGESSRNMVQRTFVQIGAHRVMSPILAPYIDDFLQKAVNQGESKVGVWQWPMYGTHIVAIRMPDGSVRSEDEVPGVRRGYKSQFIMMGGVIAVAGSLFLGLMMGNLGVLLCLAGGVLFPYLGLKALREAKQVG